MNARLTDLDSNRLVHNFRERNLKGPRAISSDIRFAYINMYFLPSVAQT